MDEARINPTHSFEVEEAVKFGSIEKAVIVKEIRNLSIYKQRTQNKESLFCVNGKYYFFVYYSARALIEKFPYMSEESVKRWLRELETDGILVSCIKNLIKYDKTKSYALSCLPVYKVTREDENDTWEYRMGQNDPQSLENDPHKSLGQNDPSKGHDGPSKGQSGLTIPSHSSLTNTLSASRKKIETVNTNNDGDVIRRVDRKKKVAPTTSPEFALAVMWSKMASDATDIPKENVPISKFFFVAKNCREKFKFTNDDFKSLFRQFFDDPKITRDQKLAYELCMSENYVSKYILRRDRVPKTFSELSSEIPL